MFSFINGLRKNGRSNTTQTALWVCRGLPLRLLQEKTTRECQHQVTPHDGGYLFALASVPLGPGRPPTAFS